MTEQDFHRLIQVLSPLNINIKVSDDEDWLEPVLCRIEHKLNRLLEGENKLMAGQAELDAAIAALQADLDTQTTAIDAAVQMIIDKLKAAGNPVDLQPEIDALSAISTKLDSVKDTLPQP